MKPKYPPETTLLNQFQPQTLHHLSSRVVHGPLQASSAGCNLRCWGWLSVHLSRVSARLLHFGILMRRLCDMGLRVVVMLLVVRRPLRLPILLLRLVDGWGWHLVCLLLLSGLCAALILHCVLWEGCQLGLAVSLRA